MSWARGHLLGGLLGHTDEGGHDVVSCGCEVVVFVGAGLVLEKGVAIFFVIVKKTRLRLVGVV